jgi:hypothetical protein
LHDQEKIELIGTAVQRSFLRKKKRRLILTDQGRFLIMHMDDLRVIYESTVRHAFFDSKNYCQKNELVISIKVLREEEPLANIA